MKVNENMNIASERSQIETDGNRSQRLIDPTMPNSRGHPVASFVDSHIKLGAGSRNGEKMDPFMI